MSCLLLTHSLRQTTAVFSLLQMYLSRRYCFSVSLSSSPLKQNLNSSSLCFYSKKSLKMGYLKCPWEKIWNSYFCKSACVEWANSHFFEELGCQHCMPGRFWIWFVSLGHPVLLHQQQRWNTSASTTITLGGGQKKAVRLCIQTWISLRKYNPLFLFRFHLQLISSVYA